MWALTLGSRLSYTDVGCQTLSDFSWMDFLLFLPCTIRHCVKVFFNSEFFTLFWV